MSTESQAQPTKQTDAFEAAFAPGKVHAFKSDGHTFGVVAFPPLSFEWPASKEDSACEGTADRAVTPIVSQVNAFIKQSGAPEPISISTRDPAKIQALTVNVCFSYRCTLNCSYCYRQTGTLPESKHMDPDTVRRAVDFVLEWPGFADRDINFGFSETCEPLLHLQEIKSLREYVRLRATSLNKRAFAGRTLLTNGTLVTEDIFSDPSFIANRVYLSLDGPPEIHDYSRTHGDGQPSYAEVVRAAELLLDHGAAIGVAAVLTGRDPRVLDIFLHHKRLGFNSIGIKPVRLPNDHPLSINPSNLGRVIEEYNRFVQYLMSLPDDALVDHWVRLSVADFFKRFVQRVLKGSWYAYRCRAGAEQISIDLDGKIYPCASFNGMTDWSIGTIEDGMDERKVLAFYSDAHVDNRESCRSCWARYLCGGGCYYQAVLVNGSMFSPDQTKCKLVKHLIELAVVFSDHLRSKGSTMLSVLGYQSPSTSQSVPLYRCRRGGAIASLTLPPASGAEMIMLCDRQQVRMKSWGGPNDLSAKAYAWWNEKAFNLVATVHDDVFFQPFDETWFAAGDSLRFAIKNPRTDQVNEFGAALISGKAGLFRTANGALVAPLDPSLVQIVREGAVTRYAISIPWAEAGGKPSVGEVWAFGLAVVDNDRTSAGWMEWSGGILPRIDEKLFGHIVFEA